MYYQESWPYRNLVPAPIKPYINFAEELTIQNDLPMRGSRMVIPVSLQVEMLQRLHSAHQGVQVSTVQQSVW